MGMINKVKQTLSNTDVDLDDWNVLTTKEQVDELIRNSKERVQLIYKHSHRCGTCLVARKEIERAFGKISDQAAMNFVNVVENRAVSNQIAEQLGVHHESPQVLIVNKEQAVWHESHYSIESEAIIEEL